MEPLKQLPTVRRALLQRKLSSDRVECALCERRCVIPPGSTGFCGTRVNMDGELFTLVYGDISSIESRPIEIKPFFHFWPGSTALTYSTWSCNFRCPWCQNWTLSRSLPQPESAAFTPPELVVRNALIGGDEGLCVSFQEPTLLTEFAAETFRAGRERGLYACYVSNGYMTNEALALLRDSGLTGLKIDVKGDAEAYRNHCGGVDVEKVWRNAAAAKAMAIHVEIVNLVVTNVNDGEEQIRSLVERHLMELGPEAPIHFTRYRPAYEFSNPPTKVKALEKARQAAWKAGVLFPYIGNVPGHRYENTYCPSCGELLIKRYGTARMSSRLAEGTRCPRCRREIPITGRVLQKRRQPLF